jgi:hypothetical protein
VRTSPGPQTAAAAQRARQKARHEAAMTLFGRTALQDTSLFGLSSQNPARYFRVQFSGSGSEYLRIWIVNLLLTVLTLGLYLTLYITLLFSYVRVVFYLAKKATLKSAPLTGEQHG